MKERLRKSVLILLLLAATGFILISCSDANKSFEQGDYQGALKALENKANPEAGDYLLKARCYEALGDEGATLKNALIFLLMDADNSQRPLAVEYFTKLNTYSSLSIMVLKPEDGLQAQIALFKAYCELNRTEEAQNMIEQIEEQTSSMSILQLLVSYGDNLDYTAEAFTLCLEELTEENKEEYLDLLCQYSQSQGMGEVQARQCLAVTDTLMNDPFYNQNNLILSKLLKTKGNILEKLYDRINARVYWNQALRLNPEDQTLKDKLQ